MLRDQNKSIRLKLYGRWGDAAETQSGLSHSKTVTGALYRLWKLLEVHKGYANFERQSLTFEEIKSEN